MSHYDPGICMCVSSLSNLPVKVYDHICLFHVALDSMKCLSMFSILFAFIVVGVVLSQFVLDPLVSDTVEIWHITGNLFGVIPVMCVSFNCHYNVPRYYYVSFE